MMMNKPRPRKIINVIKTSPSNENSTEEKDEKFLNSSLFTNSMALNQNKPPSPVVPQFSNTNIVSNSHSNNVMGSVKPVSHTESNNSSQAQSQAQTAFITRKPIVATLRKATAPPPPTFSESPKSSPIIKPLSPSVNKPIPDNNRINNNSPIISRSNPISPPIKQVDSNNSKSPVVSPKSSGEVFLDAADKAADFIGGALLNSFKGFNLSDTSTVKLQDYEAEKDKHDPFDDIMKKLKSPKQEPEQPIPVAKLDDSSNDNSSMKSSTSESSIKPSITTSPSKSESKTKQPSYANLMDEEPPESFNTSFKTDEDCDLKTSRKSSAKRIEPSSTIKAAFSPKEPKLANTNVIDEIEIKKVDEFISKLDAVNSELVDSENLIDKYHAVADDNNITESRENIYTHNDLVDTTEDDNSIVDNNEHTDIVYNNEHNDAVDYTEHNVAVDNNDHHDIVDNNENNELYDTLDNNENNELYDTLDNIEDSNDDNVSESIIEDFERTKSFNDKIEEEDEYIKETCSSSVIDRKQSEASENLSVDFVDSDDLNAKYSDAIESVIEPLPSIQSTFSSPSLSSNESRVSSNIPLTIPFFDSLSSTSSVSPEISCTPRTGFRASLLKHGLSALERIGKSTADVVVSTRNKLSSETLISGPPMSHQVITPNYSDKTSSFYEIFKIYGGYYKLQELQMRGIKSSISRKLSRRSEKTSTFDYQIRLKEQGEISKILHPDKILEMMDECNSKDLFNSSSFPILSGISDDSDEIICIQKLLKSLEGIFVTESEDSLVASNKRRHVICQVSTVLCTLLLKSLSSSIPSKTELAKEISLLTAHIIKYLQANFTLNCECTTTTSQSVRADRDQQLALKLFLDISYSIVPQL